MNSNQFTHMLIQAFESAHKTCENQGFAELNSLVLCDSLVNQSEGLVPQILNKFANKELFLQNLKNKINKLPKVTNQKEVYLAPSIKESLEKASLLSKEYGDSFISTDIMFLSLSYHISITELLKQAGISSEDIKKQIKISKSTFQKDDNYLKKAWQLTLDRLP